LEIMQRRGWPDRPKGRICAGTCGIYGEIRAARPLLFRRVIPKESMLPRFSNRNEGFDRLERLLLNMRAGDDLTVHDAANATGLTTSVCQAVFERLERVGLMSHTADDRFVRKTLDLRT
jgi:hypothetical protein